MSSSSAASCLCPAFKLDASFKPVFDNWSGNAGEDWMVGSMRLKNGQKQRRVPCYRTWDLSILVDGSVRLCGCRVKTSVWDDLVIGHLDDNSLQEISLGALPGGRQEVRGRRPT